MTTRKILPSKEDLKKLTTDQIFSIMLEMDSQIKDLEKEIDKIKKNNQSNSRENFFIMKLATKDQELRETMTQLKYLKESLVSPVIRRLSSSELVKAVEVAKPAENTQNENVPTEPEKRSEEFVLTGDPAINFIIDNLMSKIEMYKKKLDDANDELKVLNFSTDSVVGRKLIKKCRVLRAENEQLNQEFVSGSFHRLKSVVKMERKNRREIEENFIKIDDIIQDYESQIEALESIIARQNQDLSRFLNKRT